MSDNKKNIAVLLGDPSGIGPELIVKLLDNKICNDSNIVVIGEKKILEDGEKIVGKKTNLKFVENSVSKLTPSAGIQYKGKSEELKETTNELFIIFALSLLTAYLVMAATFNSWIHPAVIMLSVPLSVIVIESTPVGKIPWENLQQYHLWFKNRIKTL